mmetsp:Transcript_141388/g.451906  ORF Transcript_141388/g.451906 Transcript_141388/m.451906 type:complete len:425 (-) Transcript_141388:191-1465(-)|eukprot:CAMPEP_0203880280 /NCGR_PEP_ID=MMETSP0359-20131031/24666_1 /ASSEMBLY_ACC=CAM_ASM_000338 /TAXON_ID=268821 /ORGANISM="Scrippsiella Hangoei, Strain SHTV-5" /LENGTH=424 /DNA_ID=CAMNT_0050799867 /DNA_START=91 /DNA_END=1365 /DNA_ORIENTATION=-
MHGRKGLAIALTGVLVWVLGGACVYYSIGNCSTIPRMDKDGIIDDNFVQCPWTFAQAFYFSVQTGLSIGFGLLSESKKISEVYSCFHILAGSSVISGALALFANITLQKNDDIQTNTEKTVFKLLQQLHTDGSCSDGYKGLDMQELRDIMVIHPHYAEVMIHKSVPDKQAAGAQINAFTAASAGERKHLASMILEHASNVLPELADHKVCVKTLQDMDRETRGPVMDVVAWCRRHRNLLTAQFAFCFWILIGTMFSVLADENDVITGIYFAISTLSTAGMVATKTVDSQAHVTFVGFFALTGIPVYCTYLGMFANLLVERYQNTKMEDKMRARFTASEVALLDHVTEGEKDYVTAAEFAEIQLLRMGLVDRDTLRALREQFKKLDPDGSGTIKKAEFLHPLVADRGQDRAPETPSAANPAFSFN